MCKLSSLFKNNDTVWFYCRTDHLAEQFLEQCEKEGFRTLNNQKPKELFHHRFYGIFDNFTMGYLSNMIWCQTFQELKDEHVRVNYERFIFAEKDYICKKNDTKRLDYSDWSLSAYSNGMRHKEYYEFCEHYIEGLSFEDYNAYIFRYLIESNWNYTPEQTIKRMEWQEYYIAQCYLRHVSISECAIEVGYGCG